MPITFDKILKIKNILTNTGAYETDQGFQLGIAPFDREEGIELARMLLKAIQVLGSTTYGIDPAIAAKVRSMLQDNFDILYNNKMREILYDESNSYEITYLFKKNPIDILLNGEEIKIKDILSTENYQYPELEYVYDRLKNFYNHFNLANIELLKEIAPLMKFAAEFYEEGGINWQQNSILLSIMFDNMEDVINYLKTVDFSQSDAVRAKIFDFIPGNMAIIGLSEEQVQAWHKINAKFGREAITWFSVGAKINEHDDILELVNSSKSDDELCKTLSHLALKASYPKCDESEESNEIAKLCLKYKVSDNNFNRIVDVILPHKKSADLLPELNRKFKILDKEFNVSKMLPGDPQTLFIGTIYNLDNDFCDPDPNIIGKSENSVINAFTKKYACYYLVKNSENKLVSTIYAEVKLKEQSDQVITLYSNAGDYDCSTIFDIIVGSYLMDILDTGAFKEIYFVDYAGRFSDLSTKLTSLEENTPQKEKEFYYCEGLYSKLTSEIINKFTVKNDDGTITKGVKPGNNKIKSDGTFEKYVANHYEVKRLYVEENYGEYVKQFDAYHTDKRLVDFIYNIRKFIEEKIYSIQEVVEVIKESRNTCFYGYNYSQYSLEIASLMQSAKENETSFSEIYKAIMEVVRNTSHYWGQNEDFPDEDSLHSPQDEIYNASMMGEGARQMFEDQT